MNEMTKSSLRFTGCVIGGMDDAKRSHFARYENAYRLFESTDSTKLLFAEEKLLQKRLGVKAEIYIFDGLFAFSSPFGRVFVAQDLIHRMGLNRAATEAVVFVVAHEYAHQLQFRTANTGSEVIPNRCVGELQADVIAGYWIGSRFHEGNSLVTLRTPYDRLANDLMSYSGIPNINDLPLRFRADAVEAGLLAGDQAKFGPADQAFISNANQIFEWSAQIAKKSPICH